jgi:DeoR/GlpR family transcriptional regulator of sugar metabolism
MQWRAKHAAAPCRPRDSIDVRQLAKRIGIVLAEERQRFILSTVNTRGSISIAEIKRKLKVSRETIRRDIVALADGQRLRKTHGGALSLEQSEPEMTVRQVTNAAGKRAIGRLSASLVPDGASVILASGTTVQAVANALMSRRDLTVFTNNVVSCGKLMGRNGNRVHMLGGEVQPINGATLGRDTTAMLANYFADFVFIGAGAISPAGWLMDYTREEGELHSLMLQSARTAVVVADHGNSVASHRSRRQLRKSHASGYGSVLDPRSRALPPCRPRCWWPTRRGG